jgi:acetyl esterase/lipase
VLALALVALTGCTSIATAIANLPSRFADYSVDRDIPYSPDRGLALDVYRPQSPTETARPVVMFVHGGAWDRGSKDQYLFVGEALVARGYVAVLPAYRLYPQVRFPAFVDDVALAVAWVRDEIAAYGGDPRQIWLMGHSAGAHIAALLAFDDHYLESAGVRPCRVQGFIGLAGPYDFLPFGSDELRRIFAGTEPAATQPINFVDGTEPPVLLLHGERDDTVWPRNSRRLAERIRQYDGTVREVYYPELDHAGLVAALSRYFRDERNVLDEIDDFIGAQNAVQRACEPPRSAGSQSGDSSGSDGSDVPRSRNRSVARTSSWVMPGSKAEWPASSTMRKSASGQARCRSHAVCIGHTTS